MNKINKNLPTFLIILLLFLSLTPAHGASIVFTAPPRESADAGEKVYGPLAQHLSKLLGTQVEYKHPGNWLRYQFNLRNDEYDIIFDGPHFVSWRMAHLGHEVLVKLPGTLEFFIIARAGDTKITKLEDLAGKKVCGIPPPNLATMTLLSQFDNPARQPLVKGVKGGMPGVFKAFKEGQCLAAVQRTTFYQKKLSDEDRALTKILFKSEPLPNQAISVSRRISPSMKSRIIDSLTIGEGVTASQPIVNRFGGKKAKSFLPAKQQEFEGHNNLLEGVAFGW